jgi:hypothetical protein
MVVHMTFNAGSVVQDPVFGIVIDHVDGHMVAGTNTLRQGQTVGHIHGPGQIDVVIPALPLSEGTYDLSVAIGDRTERHDYDYWRRPIRFDVGHGERVTVGYVDLGCEFRLDKVTSAGRSEPQVDEGSRGRPAPLR